MVLRCLLLALILPSFAWARDARSVRKEAAALVAEGKTVQAATLLGKALAAVQKKGDLVGQHDYYDALASVLAWQNRLAKPTADGAYRDCCFALMTPLDGQHGWYFHNTNDFPVAIELNLSGCFDEVVRYGLQARCLAAVKFSGRYFSRVLAAASVVAFRACSSRRLASSMDSCS